MKDDYLKEEVVKELEILRKEDYIILHDIYESTSSELDEIRREIREERKSGFFNFFICLCKKFCGIDSSEFMEDIRFKSEVEKRAQVKKLHFIMQDENVEMVNKLQTLLGVAKEGSKYRNATRNTAKIYLMGLVRFLKQYEDTDHAWKWLDSQFDNYYYIRRKIFRH